jgi:hypothetical protein
MSAKNFDSTQVAGFLMGLVSFDFGLTTVELLADLTGDGAGPIRTDLANVDQALAFLLAEIERGDAGRILDEADHGEVLALRGLDLQPAFVAM